MAVKPARWQPALFVTLVFAVTTGLTLALTKPPFMAFVTSGATAIAALVTLIWIIPRIHSFTVGRDRLTWLLIGLSILALLATHVSWMTDSLIKHPLLPAPWDQVAYLASFGLLWLGVMGRSGLFPLDTVSRLVSLCDVLVAIGAAIILTGDPANINNARIFNLSFLTATKLALVTLISLIVMLHRATPRAMQGPRALLGLGIGLLIAKDVGLGAFFSIGMSSGSPLIAMLGPTGLLIIGVAGRWEASVDRHLTQPERAIDPLPSLAGMLVPAVMVIAAMFVASQTPTQSILFGMTLLVLLVMARQIVTFEKDRRHYQELQELYTVTAHEATTDPLTGLANQRHFLERLDIELRRARRYRRSLAVIFADLDHFKAINDTYGHHAGDIALKAVATCITRIVRETDLVVRYGGEEFVVLLPETSLDQAEVMAERARRAIESLQIPLPQGGTKRITMSFGVAAFPATADAPEDLLSCADAAMYHAKSLGRNRVMVAEAPEETML